MIGSILNRGLMMILGYAYPAYECYKCVEQNKPEIQELIFWCKYWILIAVITVGERIGDAFISWLPMYSEAKLAFIVYLWFPKTKGTTYVYSSFFRPYLAKHETEIDRNLMEIKTRVGDIAVLSFQRAATYSQTRIFDVLQYIAAQSVPTRRRVPQQEGAPRVSRPTPVPNQPTANANVEPLSPTSSSSSSQDSQNQDEVEEDYVVLHADKTLTSNSSTGGGSSKQLAGKQSIHSDIASSSSEAKDSNPPLDTLRATRARERRNTSSIDC